MNLSENRILLTGGSGLLGKHLKINADRPSHQELDITKDIPVKKYDLVIHAAAYTNVEKAETDEINCFRVNVMGTLKLLKAYPSTPFVYISSEYAYKPVNFYSTTKAMAEELVELHPRHLIIRTLFKPRPWKYPKAFIDQYTMGDYVDVIAPLIEKTIEEWDGKNKMIYVGTGRKTIYSLARQTRDVEPISVNDIKGVKIPNDYT